MENHVMMEVAVQGLTLRKEVPDAWSGGNPLYHAKEARKVIDQVADEIDALIVSRYGDIRGREFNRTERLEAKNVRFDPAVWNKADAKAKAEGTNLSAVLRQLLEEWVS
jgi:macrodomain Ter protein organizer (MatP/YcbG family)